MLISQWMIYSFRQIWSGCFTSHMRQYSPLQECLQGQVSLTSILPKTASFCDWQAFFPFLHTMELGQASCLFSHLTPKTWLQHKQLQAIFSESIKLLLFSLTNQGQENDIILISLVRSNNKSTIGYLSSMNRLCVAISRARCGLYLFGNHAHLATLSKRGWKVGVSCCSLGTEHSVITLKLIKTSEHFLQSNLLNIPLIKL